MNTLVIEVMGGAVHRYEDASGIKVGMPISQIYRESAVVIPFGDPKKAEGERPVEILATYVTPNIIRWYVERTGDVLGS